MDLSKAYDCLPHDLLISKLEAYGFDNNSLHFLYNYLTNRKQRVKDTVTLEFTFFLKNIFFHKYMVFVIYYKFSKQKI